MAITKFDPAAVTEDEICAAASDRNGAIKLIRAALRARSGKSWSVIGDRGSAWGWISIKSPPARAADQWGSLTEAEAAELGELLGYDRPVHHQGEDIPASADHRRGMIQRALGRPRPFTAGSYWD